MEDLQGFLNKLQSNISQFSDSDDVYNFIINIMSEFRISLTNEEALQFADKFADKYLVSNSPIRKKKKTSKNLKKIVANITRMFIILIQLMTNH